MQIYVLSQALRLKEENLTKFKNSYLLTSVNLDRNKENQE